MTRLLVLYNQPADPAAFDKYYSEKHLPIFRKVSGVRSMVFSSGPPRAIAGTAPHLIVAITFASMVDFERALNSPEGQAAKSDLANFAQAGVTILVYDTREGK